MKKKIAAMTLAIYLSGGFGAAYANEVTSPIAIMEEEKVNEIIKLVEIEDSAGILPDSFFYSIERGIEELQTAITQSEEKLAALKAQFATERAAEAALMIHEDQEELASKATSEYLKLVASAGEHLGKAVEAKNEAVQILESLNEEWEKSESILKATLEKAPEDTKVAIENALNEQDKAIAAVNGFYAAKKAFFAAKEQFEEAKKELKAAKKSGDEEAIKIAQDKVKAAEALKDELEALKDSADSAKEEIKDFVKEAEKKIELGLKQTNKANEKMAKVEEKAIEKAEKIEEKATKMAEKEDDDEDKEEDDDEDKEDDDDDEKAREEIKKAKEKAREEAKKAEEKAREEMKKAEEKAREEMKKAKEMEREEVE